MKHRKLVLTLTLAAIAIVLMLLFPAVTQFAEAAALDIRRFWWVVLGISLSFWLLSGSKK